MSASLCPQPNVKEARIRFEGCFGLLQASRYEAEFARFDFNALVAAADFGLAAHQADNAQIAPSEIDRYSLSRMLNIHLE